MFEIQHGSYDIQCVLVDSETVVNNDGIRQLEIAPDTWTIAPVIQKFDVIERNQQHVVLASNGSRYFAELEQPSHRRIMIRLKRENVAEVISIEAERNCTDKPDCDSVSVSLAQG